VTTVEHQRTLLTVKETAERLGISAQSVRRHIRYGRLPAVQLGGRGSAVRIDERALNAWLYGERTNERRR
jgi:excisionase family DNA binding protein